MTLRQIFALNLRRVRAERQLSQEALADLAGMDRTYVSSLERQVHSASLDTIEKLADVLEVGADELLKHH